MDEKSANLRASVKRIMSETPVFDMHTHLYPPSFGDLMLWGIDDLLVFHYLVAEGLRWGGITPENFWRLSKGRQADFIWDELFVKRSPLSEAARGVTTTLHRFGLDPKQTNLTSLRSWFAAWKPDDFVNHCMTVAGVETICMTNSPFDLLETPHWSQPCTDSRFASALRIDPLLNDPDDALCILASWGYETRPDLGGETMDEVRRFLGDWTKRIDPLHVMASLPPEFAFPTDTPQGRMLEEAILPFCRDAGMPLALMLGVRRQINPALRLAGDGVGRSDLSALSSLCAAFPDVRFLATVLARECQQELCVIARKFANLHPFGCWWFMNVPSLIDEVTRMRIELLGTSFTAQHSDARVMDQIVYKWDHSRAIIGEVLADKYAALLDNGWETSESEIKRDVAELLGGSFKSFVRR